MNETERVQQFIIENQRVVEDSLKMLADKEQQWKREEVTRELVLRLGQDQVGDALVDEVLRVMEAHGSADRR